MKPTPSFIAVALLAMVWIAAAEPPRLATPAPGFGSASADNDEVAELAREDQQDRRPPAGQSIDWSVVIPRDQAREKRVKELYAAGALHTGTDYYNVAMVLQHGTTADDMLLAHELCVVAIIKGENRAKWLAAASEDRFLMNIGRPQRFGTQYTSSGNGPTKLYRMEPGVTDDVRRAMDVPALGGTAAQ